MSEKLAVEHPVVRNMSPIERSEARMRVAMQSPGQLKRWAAEAGRAWLVFNTADLIDSLPYPDGHEMLMNFIRCYRDHRATISSTEGGEIEQREPMTGKTIMTPKTKPETLELAEVDRCIRYLIGLATTMDSTWTLDRSPM